MTPPRTFTISLPPKVAREVDKIARSEGRTRSELFREALRQYVDRKARWERVFSLGQEIAGSKNLTEDEVARIVEDERRSRAR